MGGRGSYAVRTALQRRTATRFNEVRRENIQSRVEVGGGGAATTVDGIKMSGATDAQIKAALGKDFDRVTAAKTMGATSGSVVRFSVQGNEVESFTTNESANFKSHFRLVKDSTGIVFHGDSLFSNDGGNIASGSAIRGIRGIRSGLKDAILKGQVYKVQVSQAIGSARNQSSQGSGLWARMGVSTDLSKVYGLNARPANLASAKTVADLQLTKAGRDWWTSNRQGFRGEVNFKTKSSSAYKVASKFLGIKRK